MSSTLRPAGRWSHWDRALRCVLPPPQIDEIGAGTAEAVSGKLASVVRAESADRRPLVGRAGEVDALVGLARRAVQGRAGALLVTGAAGVGKTALLREGCRQVAADADVLWAGCLPLTSLAVPFLPLRSALREWAAGGVPVPALVHSAGAAPGGGAVEFDVWLDGVCRQRPVLLMVDDLHWADQSSLDVLMYVVAGPAQRRLAIAATVREGEVGPGHPLRRWLADVRRLPGVESLRLDRLDRLATAQQLAGLLGSPPRESLVDDLFARTRGNAYLTTLLARGLPPDATRLPRDLPADLRDAVVYAWQALSQPARELTRLIAIAGRPQRADRLYEVAAATGLGGEVVPLLREAVDGGVLAVGSDGRCWFVHPLLAEVLEEGLLPEERRARHAAFAKVLEPSAGQADLADQAGVEPVVDLADHHYRAEHVEEAYRWALRGAEAADRAGGSTEMLRLLRRAVDLWPRVPDPDRSRVDLLRRIRDAAERTGEHEEELAAVEDLLTVVDRDRQPLLRAELLVRRMQLRFFTGREFGGLAGVREAVEISAVAPGSAEHALAMAELADVELWRGVPSGPARAQEALRLARACGSAKALTYALTAMMLARLVAGEGAVPADAEESQAAAARVPDFFAFVHASIVGAFSIDASVRAVVDTMRRSREQLTALGAPHAYAAWLGAQEAQGLLLLGEWRACVERLRVALGASPGPTADVIARLTAAQLACWQGRSAEALAHLARADELFAEQSTFVVHPFDAVRTELAVASGDTERAVSTALTAVQADVPSSMIERVIPLAARALATEAQSLRDQGADSRPVIARLDDLRRRYPEVVADLEPGQAYQAQLRAMQALYDAEVCRARLDADAGNAWMRAADGCHEGELAWDEAYARWRAAEALLPDRESREAGVAALRRAYELAVDLQAAPLLSEVEALARGARVPLTVEPVPLPVETAALSGLTPREREILGYVAAGRTYGEIARTLVVSEKTISVHISNMLRKTGTANRVELTQLAQRLTDTAAGRP